MNFRLALAEKALSQRRTTRQRRRRQLLSLFALMQRDSLVKIIIIVFIDYAFFSLIKLYIFV
jgi:hypothetical protein